MGAILGDPREGERKPLWGKPPLDWLMHRVGHLIWSVLDLLWFRSRTRHLDRVPQHGPVLLLSNHTAALDPFWVAWPLWRPCSYMAANSLLDMPVGGAILRALGAFPKRKFVKDADSMAEMERRYNRGDCVVLYPEGDRTWDGRLGHVPPGIGRTIKRLGARVVYARMTSAHLAEPRWAKGSPRRLPIEIEYDGPYTFTPDTSPEEITAHVIEHITCEQRLPEGPRWGRNLAWGLEELLWACPRCYAIGGLDRDPADGDAIACGSCGARWRLGFDMRLTGEGGGAEALTVIEARDRLRERFGHPPVLDRARLEQTGVLMEGDTGSLKLLAKGKEPAEIARGTLRLTPARLSILGPDGAERWGAELALLQSATIEVKNRVYMRLPGQFLRLDVEGKAVLRWAFFVLAWYNAARERGEG